MRLQKKIASALGDIEVYNLANTDVEKSMNLIK